MTQIISVARDFSKFPAGRHVSDGPASGEGFRNDVLAPALRQGPVVVLMDGTMGYGASFLEEAFGGLVRESGFTREQLESNLKIEASDGALVKKVWEFLK